MATLYDNMIQVYILGALLLIAFVLLGMWITRDAKRDNNKDQQK